MSLWFLGPVYDPAPDEGVEYSPGEDTGCSSGEDKSCSIEEWQGSAPGSGRGEEGGCSPSSGESTGGDADP